MSNLFVYGLLAVLLLLGSVVLLITGLFLSTS